MDGAMDVPAARMLVVEDDRLLRQLATEMLCDEGFAAIGFAGGDEALARPDLWPDAALLITDINMPGMSGLDLARLVQGRYPEVPVLLISGREHIHASSLPRPFYFLQKPFSAGNLLARVRSIIGQRSAPAQACP